LPTNTPIPFIEIENLGVREGDVLFGDDFETDFAARWTIMWGIWRVVDEEGVEGNKVFYTNSGGSMPPLWYSGGWTNYQADLRVKVLDLPEDGSTVGILFRHMTYAVCPSYNLWMDQVSIGLSYTDEECNWHDLATWDTPIIRNQWVDLRIVAVDETLLVYSDKKLIINVTDGTLPNGTVRLEAWDGARAYFDDVRIVQLVSEE
jgi:hypothetical protein